jgi:integrase
MYILKSIRKVLGVRWSGDGFVSKFRSVQKLIDHLWWRKSGSPRSVTGYCWVLSSFCSWAKCSPDDIVCKSREELETLVQTFLDEVNRRSRKRGLSARYVNNIRACLITFFRVNGFNRENNKELRVQGYHQPPRVRNRDEYVPSLEEACRMAERAGSIRNRAIIRTMYSTGLRNAALRAILVGDVLREIEAGYENLLIKVEPEWNKRIPGACKNNIPYYTFTSAQATRDIKEMLKRRKEIFGSISEDEPLFISLGSLRSRRKPLSPRELEEIVKNAAREADIKDWKLVKPHSLRKVFESVLRSPMIDGDRMDPKDQEFLMGHVLQGSQDAYYDWTKIDKLRNQFAKLCFEHALSPEGENLNMTKQIARLFGFNVDDVKTKKEKELGRKLTIKEEIDMLQTIIKSRLNAQGKNGEQKLIRKEELQTYLDKGWKFLSVIDENTVIVQNASRDSINIDFEISKLFMDMQNNEKVDKDFNSNDTQKDSFKG